MECLRTAYATRIKQLVDLTTVRGVKFEISTRRECAAIPDHTYVEAKDLPKEFLAFVPFVPTNSTELDGQCADIKGDDSRMYLLVTRARDGEPGTLSLFSRQREGSLAKGAKNHTVVQGATSGGSHGGYEGVDSGLGYFTIRNRVGSMIRSTECVDKFRYDRRKKAWMCESSVEVTDDRQAVSLLPGCGEQN